MTQPQCQSCAMPIASGRYCQYCTDAQGNLQPFEERFARMVAWMARQQPALSREEAERRTLAYLAEMPAWRDDPKVKAASGR
jgi:hypothetical protein